MMPLLRLAWTIYLPKHIESNSWTFKVESATMRGRPARINACEIQPASKVLAVWSN